MTTQLIYLGKGAIIHVPARDLTEADFEERRELWAEQGITEESLIESGLYKKAGRVPLTGIQYGRDGEGTPVEKTIKSSNEPASRKSKAGKDGEA